MTYRVWKDPQAVLEYGFDWSEWLVGADTISAATWTVPAGLTKASESNTTTTSTVWLSGGVRGNTYAVSCHITTAGGRQDDRSIQIYCEER
jgi:hypothetical protein